MADRHRSSSSLHPTGDWNHDDDPIVDRDMTFDPKSNVGSRPFVETDMSHPLEEDSRDRHDTRLHTKSGTSRGFEHRHYDAPQTAQQVSRATSVVLPCPYTCLKCWKHDKVSSKSRRGATHTPQPPPAPARHLDRPGSYDTSRRSSTRRIDEARSGWWPFQGQQSGDTRLARLENDLARRDQEIQALGKKIGDLEQQIRQVSRERDRFTAAYEDAHDQLLEARSGSTWIGSQSVQITDKLDELKHMIGLFAKNFSKTTLSIEDYGPLMHQLSFVMRTGGTLETIKATCDNLGTRVVAYLLHALLSFEVFCNVLTHPFRIISDHPEELEAACVSLSKLDEAQAHSWRAQAFRIMRPPLLPSLEDTSSETVSQRRLAMAEDLTTSFSTSNAGCLLSRDEAKVGNARRDLKSIFTLSVAFAHTISAESAHVKAAAFDDLKLEQFEIPARILEPHNFHRRETEEDMRCAVQRLRGSAPLLIVSPAILAYGNKKGERYESYEVWSKAVAIFDS